MSYPIQPTIVKNYFRIWLQNVAFTWSADVTDYVTSFTASAGGEPDNYFFTQVAGTATLELFDTEALISAGRLIPGYRLLIKTVSGAQKSTYTIQDVKTNYTLDPRSGAYVYVSTVELADMYAVAANITINDYELFSGTGETQTIPSFTAPLYSSSYTSIFYNAGDWIESQSINQFVKGGSVVEIIDRVAKGVGGYQLCSQTGSANMSTFNIKPIPTAAATSPALLLTDGTHASVPAGATRYDYVSIEYGQETASVISSCTFNNYGLDRAPQSTTDKTVTDIVVPYKSTQSIGYTRAAKFDSAVATNNLGWNLVQEDGTGRYAPQNWGSSNVGTWRFTRPSMSNASYLGEHGVVRAKCLPSGGVAANAGFLLGAVDPDYDFVTSVPGGATGAWTAQVKVRAINTSRTLRLNIAWYDNDGVSLGYTTGTNTSVPTGSWTTLTTTTTSPPAGAVTAVPALFTNVAIAQYGMYYITELYLGRAGTSSTFFNGDTPDNASYCYTWTGERYTSPSQKNTNNIKAITDAVLARSTTTPRATSVSMNFTALLGATQPFSVILGGFSGNTTSLQSAYVCVNGVTEKYLICGINYRMTPTTVEADLNLVKLI